MHFIVELEKDVQHFALYILSIFSKILSVRAASFSFYLMLKRPFLPKVQYWAPGLWFGKKSFR